MQVIVDIPGVGEVEFPDTLSPAEIRREVLRIAGGPGIDLPESSAGASFVNAGTRQLGNNIVQGVPRIAGDALAAAAAIPQTVGQLGGQFLRGEPVVSPRDALLANFAAQQQQQPAVGLRNLPGVQDIEAAGRAVLPGQVGPSGFPTPLNIGTRFRDARGERAFQEFVEQAQNPIASFGGELAGDAASIFAGRAPVARAGRGRSIADSVVPRISTTPGARQAIDRTLNSNAVKGLIRTTGRVGEAGLEGLAVALLNGGDPLETAAFAAGGQFAGSAALGIGSLPSIFVSGARLTPIGRLTVGALALGGLTQTAKSLLPGGKDFVLESLETGFDKAALGLILGVTASAAGAGRLRGGKFAESLPAVADAITTLPRASLISAIEEILSENQRGGNTIEKVIGAVIENPGSFTPAEQRRIERALLVKDVSLSKTIDDLMKDQKFRDRIEAR